MKKVFICFLFLLMVISYTTTLNGQNPGRIESEYKLSVPKDKASMIWEYLVQEYGADGIRKVDPEMTSTVAEEIFYDQYYDNEALTLFEHQAGVRYRQRFVGDSLLKALVQLKLPLGDEEGIARQEIKFNEYTKVKKTDRKGMHEFWQHIKPRDRDKVDLHLATFNLNGDALKKKLKVKQVRNRIYVAKNGASFMTMTFDKVESAYFPYPSFIELELELNEILYTEGDEAQRAYMEKANLGLKEKLAQRFPDLVQDQTPKYNKMSALLQKSKLHFVYENLWYGVFGLITCFAGFLFLRKEYLS